MKRALPALAALLLAFGPLGAEEAGKKTPPAKGPRIAVEPASFDFGRAVQDRTLQKEFSLRNFGSEDLVVESVSTTCGCTAALMDSKVVKPGGTTPLRVSLETRNYTGRIVRSVMVRSNDPVTKLLEVKVEATVVPAK
jgi:hypothetical protein